MEKTPLLREEKLFNDNLDTSECNAIPISLIKSNTTIDCKLLFDNDARNVLIKADADFTLSVKYCDLIGVNSIHEEDSSTQTIELYHYPMFSSKRSSVICCLCKKYPKLTRNKQVNTLLNLQRN